MAKAWIIFKGDGTPKSKYNVTSVVHNSTGLYTITFATPMADSEYATIYGSGQDNVCVSDKNAGTRTTTQLSVHVTACNGGTDYDPVYWISVMILR
ncbi:MAG: hypothetical protein U0T83_08485 [Bacteriovoracaceae bacterium]